MGTASSISEFSLHPIDGMSPIQPFELTPESNEHEKRQGFEVESEASKMILETIFPGLGLLNDFTQVVEQLEGEGFFDRKKEQVKEVFAAQLEQINQKSAEEGLARRIEQKRRAQ